MLLDTSPLCEDRGALLALEPSTALVGDDPLQRPRTPHLFEHRQQPTLRVRGSVARRLLPPGFFDERVWEA